MRYGEWTWLNPETGEDWRDFVIRAEETRAASAADDGNEYIGLPIRFLDIYEEWNTKPQPIDEVVRYTKPHWKYLCELLKAEATPR